MLRFAESGTVYKVPFVVGGSETIFHLKALSILERDELLQGLAESEKERGIKGLAESLSKIIVKIEGVDGAPSEILPRLEHSDDLREIVLQVARWCRLDEQTEKNWSSSREPSAPASARGNAGTSAPPVAGPASTTPTNGTGQQPEGKD